MASTKTTAKGIRISNDAWDFYADKPLNRMVESLAGLLSDGSLEFDGETLKIKGSAGVHVKKADPEWKEDLDGMLMCCGIGFDELMETVYGWVCDGTIDISDGVSVSEPGWLTRFREVCHEKCIPIEKTMENVCQKIEKGQI